MTDQYFADLMVTKIFFPPLRDGLIPRPRLVEKLNYGINKKLIVVQAPAGYGKTTLIVEWLVQAGKQHYMFAIDPNDNDLSRFLTYLIYSLGQDEPGIFEKALALIHSPVAHPTYLILAHLINSLASIKSPTTLVLDDYHLIKLDEIHKALSFILQNLPPNLQIIIVSRNEIPFSISTLRASNQTLELDISDLRFTLIETRAFVKGVLKLDFSPEELDELDNKTEGWITSLQLAMMGMNWRNNSQRIQQLSGKDRLIAEYLFDEVIAKQTAEIQDFLIKTSILERFCAPLTDTVLNVKNSFDIIRYLEQSNLFVIPLDNSQTWYRYHHLFTEFLQNWLRLHQISEMPVLWKKTIRWHETNGNKEEAIEYALKSENYEYSIELIQPVVSEILSHGGRERVIRWLAQLPVDMLRKNTTMWPFLVLANLDAGTFGSTYRVLDNLWGKEEYILSIPESEQPLVRCLRAGFLAAIVVHTTLDAAIVKGLAQQAIDQFPADRIFGKCIGFGHFGSASLLMGEIPQAREFLERAIVESKKETYERLYFLWSCYRANVEIEAGNIYQARDMINKILHSAELGGVRVSHVTTNAVLGLGRLYYEWNNMQEAEKYFSETVTMTESGEYLDHLMLAYQHYFSYLISKRDYKTARQKINLARKIAAIYDYPEIVMTRIAALETLIDIETGAYLTEDILRKRFSEWSSTYINGLNEFKWHVLAKAWIVCGNYLESITLLNKLYESAVEHERTNSVIRLGITLARAYFLNGNTAEAKNILTPVLEMAEAGGYLRSFLDEGTPIKQLMQAVLLDWENSNSTISPSQLEYIKHIISEFQGDPFRLEEDNLSVYPERKMPLLTVREREVMAYLDKGLTYNEIALRMVITENTLKTHIKHIYSKLNVRNRTEALINLKRLTLK